MPVMICFSDFIYLTFSFGTVQHTIHAMMRANDTHVKAIMRAGWRS